MSEYTKGPPKEGRLNRAKNFKADSIVKEREVLHLLEAMYLDMHDMNEEAQEKFFPQTTEKGKEYKFKKTKKEFFLSVLMAAQHNQINNELIKKQYKIDLQNKETQNILQKKINEIERIH